MTPKPRYRLQADGNIRRVTDGLTNVVANLGTSRDKAAFSQFSVPYLDPMTLMNAYRGSWAARKGVDIPALDSCRKWRDWMGQATEITALEAEEERLDVQGKVLLARIAARLFGGCALLIGADVADPSKPLNPEVIGRNGIQYLTIVHRRMLAPGMLDMDPASPSFGHPSNWMLNAGGGAMATIHPTRLVMFKGSQLPDDQLAGENQGWGDSVLVANYDTIRSFDSVCANIASLVFEAKVDTIGIPDFMNRLGDAAYEQTLLKRFALAETGKGINGTLLHDSEEILGQKQAGFASLPDIMDRFAINTCAGFDIPITRFMGQSPAGLRSTGESDIRNYYDSISSRQELEMGPAMRVLDECLIRSALGVRPPEVHYRWASLWAVDETQRAANGKVYAETVKTLNDTGLFPLEALAEAAVNVMTESGALPGFEGAVAEYHASHPNPDQAPDNEVASTTPVTSTEGGAA